MSLPSSRISSGDQTAHDDIKETSVEVTNCDLPVLDVTDANTSQEENLNDVNNDEESETLEHTTLQVIDEQSSWHRAQSTEANCRASGSNIQSGEPNIQSKNLKTFVKIKQDKPLLTPPQTLKNKSMKNQKNTMQQNGKPAKTSTSLLKAGFIGLKFLSGVSVSPKLSEEVDDSVTDLTHHIPILKAVRDQNGDSVRALLRNNPECVNDLDSQGYPPIHIATRFNDVQILELLLNHNADVNVKGLQGHTPLHAAARFNCREAAQLLIDNKASVTSKDSKQKIPLHIAAKFGHKEIAQGTCLNEIDSVIHEMLLKAGGPVTVNVCDEDMLTPLHEAVMKKHTKVVSLLIENGADLFAQEINNTIALQLAAGEDSVDIMALILSSVSVEYGGEAMTVMVSHADNEGNTALHWAVMNNKVCAAEFLIDRGASVNRRNIANSTPLHLVATNGNIAICTLLLNHNAIIEICDQEQMTPIHRAAMYNKWQIIELMMKKGGNINAKSENQSTPLMISCWKGHIQTTNFLLTNGGQISETDENHKTALHLAVEYKHLAVIQQLLQHGCTNYLNAQDLYDQTVLHYAAQQNDCLILNLLLKNGCKRDTQDIYGKTPLHIAAELGNSQSVEALVTQAEINDGDDAGRSPLLVAAEAGNYHTCRSLIVNGADISSRDEFSRTALMLAASKGHCNIMELLLDNFAEINQTDKAKNTALHMAAYSGHTDCVKLLLNRNASAPLKNSYHKTAMDVAIENSHTDTVITMLQHKSWSEVMEVRNSDGFTPIKQLIAKVPEAAMVVLDNCVEYSDHRKDDYLYTIKFDYKYIDPGPQDPCCRNGRYFALNTMIEYKREDLLAHPLVQSVLLMKWCVLLCVYINIHLCTMEFIGLCTRQKFGRIFFYTNLLLYLTFLVLLMLYSTIMPPITTDLLDDVRSCPIYVNDTVRADPVRVAELKVEGEYSNTVFSNTFVDVLYILLSIMITIYMLKEIFKLFHMRWRYFIDPYMYATWLMLLSSIISLQPPNYLPCQFNWRAIWISGLLAWTLFMLLLRGVDSIGIYFVMFTEVVKSLLKVSFVLLLFLFAFSNAFAATMARTKGFERTDVFVLTVLSMTLGEINFVDNFMGSSNEPFKIDNLIIGTLFMLVMPIAVMNLLIGVAVGDIDKIQKVAYLTKLQLKVEQIYDSETAFLKIIQRKLYQRSFKMQPNKENFTCWNKFKRKVFGLSKDVAFMCDENEDVVADSLQEIRKDLKKQKMMIIQMQTLQKQQQEMMKQICLNMNIDVRLSAISPVESIRSDTFSRMDY